MNTNAQRTRRRRALDASHQLLCRAAHWHADQGMFVFPLAPGRKVPAVDKDWEHQATTDHLKIARTWRRAPFNIGIATGPSGLLVVDLDRPKTPDDLPPEPWRGRGATCGADVLALVAADASHRLPASYAVTTPSGGQHLCFHQPTGHELGNSAGRIGWKIDTRGHGGYVVAAGSTLGGGRYTAARANSPQLLPDWITTALRRSEQSTPTSQGADLRDSSAYVHAAVAGELKEVLAATEGNRNDTLNRAAFALGQLIGGQLLDEATARDELVSAAARIGLSRTEAERTITSGLTAGARHPRNGPVRQGMRRGPRGPAKGP